RIPDPHHAGTVTAGQHATVRAEGDPVDRPVATGGQDAAPPARRAAPQPDLAVGVAAGQQVAVRVEGRGVHPPAVAGQFVPQRAGARIPQPDDAVRPPGGQQVTGLVEGEPEQRPGGSGRGEFVARPPGGDLPDPDPVAVAHTDQGAVRAEGNGPDLVRVPGEPRAHSAGPDIPQPDRSVAGSYGEQRSV